MPENMIFRIGAISIGLTGEKDREFTLQGRFPDFSSNTPAQARYTVRVSPPPQHPTGTPAFDSGQGWRLYRQSGSPVLWVRSPDRDPYLAGFFSPDFRYGEIFTSESTTEPGKLIFPLGYPMGGLLMTNLLGTGLGIMLHSCGVIDGENGMVFAGISGNGKSTTARLWDGLPGVRVVNDDHTIVRKLNGQFRVYGTPWHGEGGIALAADAPLKALFILKHAPQNQAVRLSASQAAAALLVRTFAPLWSADGMAFTLQLLEELCQAVPCYELGFLPDGSAVEYVRCLASS